MQRRTSSSFAHDKLDDIPSYAEVLGGIPSVAGTVYRRSTRIAWSEHSARRAHPRLSNTKRWITLTPQARPVDAVDKELPHAFTVNLDTRLVVVVV